MGASKKIMIVILIVNLILFLSSPCLAGMNVQEVISNMQKAYEKQMKGVNDFTVIHRSTGGMAALAGDTVTYYKKVKLDGQDIYKSRIESQVMGMDMVIINDGRYYGRSNTSSLLHLATYALCCPPYPNLEAPNAKRTRSNGYVLLN